MSVFDFDSDGQAAADETARLNPLNASQADPGFWTGTPKGGGLGVMRGGARVAQFAGMLGAAPMALYESVTDQEGRFTDAYFREVDEIANDAVDYWTPAANEVGTAGRVLGGLSEIVLPLAATGGNPLLLLGAQGMGQPVDLVRQGVGAPAAVGVGVLQAASTAVGFRLPFLGSTLATRVASGAGGNLALNTGTTALQGGLLSAAGEEAAAKQYDPFDPTARVVDLLTGVVFGGLAHVTAPRALSPTEAAAALAARNARHFQADTAPGVPVDAAAAAAHARAMEAATTALLRGEPVSVPPEALDAGYRARAARAEPDPKMLREYTQPRDTSGPDGYYRQAQAIRTALVRVPAFDINAPREVGKALGEKVLSLWQFVKETGGIVDDGGELSARDVDTKSAPGLIRKTATAETGMDAVRERVWEAGYFPDKADYNEISDTELVDAITQDVAGDRIYTNAVREKLNELRDQMQFADSMMRDGITSDMPVERIAEHLRNMDDEARALALPPEIDPAAVSEYFDSVLPVEASVPPEATAVTPDGTAKPADGEAAAAADPDVIAAQQIADTADLMIATGELDADGVPVVKSAREIMQAANDELAAAREQTRGIEAAVTCFLQRGA